MMFFSMNSYLQPTDCSDFLFCTKESIVLGGTKPPVARAPSKLHKHLITVSIQVFVDIFLICLEKIILIPAEFSFQKFEVELEK